MILEHRALVVPNRLLVDKEKRVFDEEKMLRREGGLFTRMDLGA